MLYNGGMNNCKSICCNHPTQTGCCKDGCCGGVQPTKTCKCSPRIKRNKCEATCCGCVNLQFRKVFIPAAVTEQYPVENGAYNDAIVEYEATGDVYIYSSDGIPTKIGNSHYTDTIAALESRITALENR